MSKKGLKNNKNMVIEKDIGYNRIYSISFFNNTIKGNVINES